MEQQFLDVFTTDDESLKMKRPFCNAFTGEIESNLRHIKKYNYFK